MEKWYGHPDDPANPNIGIDITNEELEELEIETEEARFEAERDENH